jgi:hypothetical protein
MIGDTVDRGGRDVDDALHAGRQGLSRTLRVPSMSVVRMS